MKTVPTQRSSLKLGRARVNWGQQTYGKPNIVASAPVEAIDDLVAAVLEAQQQIRAAAAQCLRCGSPPGPHVCRRDQQ